MSDGDFWARIVAEEDQALAGIQAVAQRVGLYRKALILQGFQPEEAWELVCEFHSLLMAASAGVGEGE